MWCLPYVDQILVLKDNIISERGTYNELLQNEGAFAEFMSTYAGLKPEDLESESSSDSNSEKDSNEKKGKAKKEGESKNAAKTDSNDGKLIKDEDEDTKDEGGVSNTVIIMHSEYCSYHFNASIIFCL